MFRHPFLIKEILEMQYRCMLIASEMVAMEVSMDGFYSNESKNYTKITIDPRKNVPAGYVFSRPLIVNVF